MATGTGSYRETISPEEVAQIRENILARRKSRLSVDATSSIPDDQWVKQAFIVDEIRLNDVDVRNRSHSSAVFKFNDSSLGGSYAINPLPQFTPYCDIRANSLLRQKNEENYSIFSTGAGYGLGTYYSEALDDSAQVIHMRFGVPQFNSLTTFFTGFFSGEAASIARTGRISQGFFATLGKVVGMVVSLVYWPILAASALGAAYRFFFKKPSSRFYYLKPTMVPYWTAVNAMVNNIAVNRGLYPMVPLLGESKNSPSLQGAKDHQIGQQYKIDEGAMKEIATMMPDIFSPKGGIDVYAVANRVQRMKNAMDDRIYKNFASGVIQPYEGYIKSDDPYIEELRKGMADGMAPDPGKKYSIYEAISRWLDSEGGELKQGAVAGDAEVMLKETTQKDDKGNETTTSFPDRMAKYLTAEFDDGSAFASFRVNYTGPVSESFSSSTAQSDLQSKFNSTSSQARSARFSFADGNLSDGMIGSTVGAIAGAVKDFAVNALDGINISGLMALGGSAFVDIPEHWDSSSASLPSSNYSMTLISPYGNAISQMTNIYIPLCMLLAGALPLATGKQSHTSPFICELYDRGRAQKRLAIIDSLSITRGTSNLGFNKEGNAMAVEVSFTVKDLSSLVSLPIDPGFSFNLLKGVFDEDNAYQDYLAVLSAMSLDSQIYTFQSFKLNLAKKYRKLDMLTSPSMWMSMVHSSPIGFLDIFYRGVERK